MAGKRSRTAVAAFSTLCAIAGTVLYAFFQLRRQPVPLYVVAVMTYGWVFVFGFLIDRVGRQASRFRQQADERRRPRPVPKGSTRAASAHAHGALLDLKQITLQPAQGEARGTFQLLMQEAATEVMALEGKRPDKVKMDIYADASAGLSRRPFLILHDAEAIGCCLLEEAVDAYQLPMLYVRASWRRAHVGRTALEQVFKFLLLLGGPGRVTITVPDWNQRAVRFFAGQGFVRDMRGEAETASWSRSLRTDSE